MNLRLFLHVALPIIGAVTAVNFLAMPRQEYHGDAEAVRAEAITLLNTGEWAVPPEIAQISGARGQYFYQNPNGAWYPKYGVLNTVMYLPPLLLEKFATGRLEIESSSRVFFLNLFNLILGAATALYLILLSRRYSESAFVITAFVFASLFSTFWWNYLRAQTFEIYHALFLLAFFYHFASAIKFQTVARQMRKAGFHFPAAGLYFGALFLTKSVYLVLLPAIVITLARVIWPGRKPSAADRMARPLSLFLLPVCFCLIVFAVANSLKFGFPFATGYTQWTQERTLLVPENFLRAIWGYLFAPRSSVFVHYPVLFFALAGWPKFFRKHKIDSCIALLFAAGLIAMNALFTNWRGESSYGPRYLLPILPIVSPPFLEYLQTLASRPNQFPKFAVFAVTAAVLFCSTLLQICVNTLPFFFCYDLKDILADPRGSPPATYLRGRPFAVVEREFLFYQTGWAGAFGRDFVQRLNAEEAERFARLTANLRSNYYWFPKLLSNGKPSP